MAECAYCREALAEGPPWAPGEGHRLAFDPRRGRLWTVCPSCGRWNLTPLEDRWETLESCERAVHDRGTEILRTPHLSLFRLPKGELIRVGDPPRTEFTDWRYGPRLRATREAGGFLTRILSRLPPPPPAGYDPYRRTFALEDESPWLASPFLEQASALRILFSQIPLAPVCPECSRPLALRPWDFQHLRIAGAPGTFRLLATCGLCHRHSSPTLSTARPALRLALGLVTAPPSLRGVTENAARSLDRVGGPQAFLVGLTREGLSIGELSLPDRAALLIALDEWAEAEALEGEWRRAEELAAISDGELTRVPGFSAFRKRVLEENPDG